MRHSLDGYPLAGKMMNGSHEDHHGAFITTPHQQKSLPDVLSSELQSLSLVADRDNNRLSFLLLDGEDNLSGNNISQSLKF